MFGFWNGNVAGQFAAASHSSKLINANFALGPFSPEGALLTRKMRKDYLIEITKSHEFRQSGHNLKAFRKVKRSQKSEEGVINELDQNYLARSVGIASFRHGGEHAGCCATATKTQHPLHHG
jgi:hypothetical protein